MQKILIIRFSSIGDIVLTSPIIRCIKEQLKDVEIHYLTKKQYLPLVQTNPHVSKVYAWEDEFSDLILKDLKAENYDFVVDLHKNLRTIKVKSRLGKKFGSFPKLNFKKWLLVNFKWDKLPDVHIVDRYFEAVKSLGVKNDDKGLDFFVSIDENSFKSRFGSYEQYVTVAIGAQFATKRMPAEKLSEILSSIPIPIVLVGGPGDRDEGERIKALLPEQIINNTCGGLSLHESAYVIKHSLLLITHDTGMMHIASAFKLPIVSIWGNTVPEFGMYPYRPQVPHSFSIHEVKNLPCRPCSKIGFQKCPKGHFKCMIDQDVAEIQAQIDEFLGDFLLFELEKNKK